MSLKYKQSFPQAHWTLELLSDDCLLTTEVTTDVFALSLVWKKHVDYEEPGLATFEGCPYLMSLTIRLSIIILVYNKV